MNENNTGGMGMDDEMEKHFKQSMLIAGRLYQVLADEIAKESDAAQKDGLPPSAFLASMHQVACSLLARLCMVRPDRARAFQELMMLTAMAVQGEVRDLEKHLSSLKRSSFNVDDLLREINERRGK